MRKLLLFLVIPLLCFGQTHKTAMQDLNNHMTGNNDFTNPILYDGIPFASLPTPANGMHAFCSDCQVSNPCTGGGSGAFARVQGGQWNCFEGDVTLGNGAPANPCPNNLQYIRLDSPGGTYICYQNAWLLENATGLSSIGVNPSVLSFGNVPIGQPSSLGTTITNTGPVAIQITSISTSDNVNFPISSDNCPVGSKTANFLPGASCVVTDQFTPSTAGALSANLSITTSVGITTVTMAGTGVTVSTPPTLVSIALSPSNPTINVGQTQAFTATGTYSDSSTQNLTNSGVIYNASGSGSGTLASVQTNKCSWNSSNGANFTCTAATNVTNTNGNKLWVFGYSSQPATINVTDSNGDTFLCGATGTSQAICYASITKTGANTITVHATQGNVGFIWGELSGVAPSNFVDAATPSGQIGSDTGPATNQAGGITYTTLGVNDVILMCGADNVAGSFTAGTGFTLAQADSAYSAGCEYKLNVAAGPISPIIVDPSSTTSWKTFSFAFMASNLAAAGISPSGVALGQNVGTSTISVNSGFVVQQNYACNNGGAGTTTLSCAFNKPQTAGDTNVVIVMWQDATATITGVTDTAGNTYTLQAHSQGNGLSPYVYTSVGIAGSASNTVTATWSGGGAATPSITLIEVQGLVASPVDVKLATTNANAFCSPGAISTAQAAEVLILACEGPSGSSVTGNLCGGPSVAADVCSSTLFASGTQTDPLSLTGGTTSAGIALSLKSAIGSTTLTVDAGTPTIFTVQNPPPVGTNFYAGSIYTTPLPSDVSSHYALYSLCAIQLEFGGQDTNGCSGGSEQNAATSVINYRDCNTVATGGSPCGGGIWYSSQSDPVYCFTTVTFPGPTGHNPAGLCFHFHNQAQWWSNQGDQQVWLYDQSTDIDPAVGGRFVSMYNFTTPPAVSTLQLPSCSCTTTACAKSTQSCLISAYYASFSYPFQDSIATSHDAGAYDSMAVAAGAMAVRSNEIVAGNIPHAMFFNDGGHHFCGPVFPAVTPPASESGSCQKTDSNHVREGNLLVLDTGFNCSTVPAGISAAIWNNLEKPFCIGLQVYGAYLSDVGGDSGSIFITHFDSGFSYRNAGYTDPLLTLVQSSVGSSNCSNGFCKDGQSSAFFGYNWGYYQDNSGFVMHILAMTGAINHFHIVDPCIPERMAHQPGAC